MKQGSPATEWGGAGGKNAGTEARCPFFPSLPFTHGYWAPVCARATQSAGDTSLSRADIPAALTELTLQGGHRSVCKPCTSARRTPCHQSYGWKGRGAERLPVTRTRRAHPEDMTAGLRWRMSSTDQLRSPGTGEWLRPGTTMCFLGTRRGLAYMNSFGTHNNPVVSEEAETERGELTCMMAHSREGQRRDLNQGAWLRAQVPALCMPATHNPITGLTGAAQSALFNLFNPENNI